MRTKVLFAALLLSATTAFAQQEKLGSGIDKTNMDLTIKPGNDFYRYAAGNWMKNHPLDAEHTDNGAFTDLFEQNQKRIQAIASHARGKGMRSIAEFVQDAASMSILFSAGVDYVEGHFLAAAGPEMNYDFE